MSENQDRGEGNCGARPKKPSKPSLAQVKKQGRELRQAAEGRAHDSGSDSGDDPMLIAGLSEMALLMEKPSSVFGTGFIYDDVCTQHKNLWEPRHPERPERVSLSYKRCCQLGLVDRCTRLQSRYGTEDQVLLLHSHALLDNLQSAVAMEEEQLKELSKKYEDVYFHQSTYECALLGLGNTLELMEQILKKNVRNGFALVRPPGHHAMESEYCGFCFYNNVAIAAKHALDTLGLNRILIVDWDVHHGQGIQQLFYNDPRVLYFSIHRYEYGAYWPQLRESDYDFIGSGDGVGYNINVPINKTGMTDSDYLAVLHQVLMPVAYEFDPDLVLVSSGYDAAIGCPEFDPDLVLVSSGYDAAIGDVKGEMMISPAAYAHFIHMLSALAEGRVCAVLEGGYCLKSLSEGVALTVRSLLGDPCPLLKPTEEPCDSVTESILNVIKTLWPYWKCLSYQTELEEDELCSFPGVNETPPREGVVFITPENRPKEYTDLSYVYPFKVEQEYIEAVHKWDAIIDSLIAETSLTVPPHRTCLVYDPAMKAHKAVSMFGHPEKPERISRIYKKHEEWALLERCLQVKSRLAEREELEMVHSSEHIEFMMGLADKNALELKSIQGKHNSIYVCKDTYICASMAAGSLLNVVDTVLTGQAQNGVAIIRPPGHHAECGKPMGFCFFNSVAIAAKFAQKKYNVKRIMILDWDVHHGNGIQHTFYDDSSVLYISLHRYDNGFFYPTSTDGNHDMVGEGKGEGYNVNIPWHYGGKGDPEYIAAFQQVVMPIAYQYAPELVLVSAGFDAAIGDPLGGCNLTPVGYGHMIHMMSSLANGRVIVALEGGYNLVSMANCMSMCTSVLLGDPCPHFSPQEPQDNAINTICDVLDSLKPYWKSLKFRVGIPVAARRKKTENRDTADSDNEQKEPGVEELGQALSNVGISEECTPSSPVEASSGTDIAGDMPGQTGAGAGSSAGAEGGSDPKTTGFSSNQDLLHHLEDQGVGQMFAVQPLKWCQHLEQVAPLPPEGLNCSAPCEECQNVGENWVCLVCYKVFCSRYVNEHMVIHGTISQHAMVLSYADLSVWCYQCDNYVDNQIVRPAKNSAHLSKFGTSIEGGAGGSEGAVGGSGPRPTGLSSNRDLLHHMEDQGVKQMFAVEPMDWCPHLTQVAPLPPRGLNCSAPCEECQNVGENWVCLVCYKVYCSRYVNEHMVIHGTISQHAMVLSYADLSVWCYQCDNYVDNQLVKPAKNSAHWSKFGQGIGDS